MFERKFGDQFRLIDAFRTSQVCPYCYERLWDVQLEDIKRSQSLPIVFQQAGYGDIVNTRSQMGMKWCNSPECKHRALRDRDENSCLCIFDKAQPSYHPIYDRASRGDQHYWGEAPKTKTLTTSGMAAARKNGMAACGKHPAEKDKMDQRKQIRKKRKGRRNRRNTHLRNNPPPWL